MRNPLSQQVIDIKPSGIRKFFDIVREMKDAISTNEAENDTNTEILRMYTTDYLNMRTGPGTEFEKIITILPGEMVQVIEREGNWAKVVFDGETGYCSLEYLEIELLE